MNGATNTCVGAGRPVWTNMTTMKNHPGTWGHKITTKLCTCKFEAIPLHQGSLAQVWSDCVHPRWTLKTIYWRRKIFVGDEISHRGAGKGFIDVWMQGILLSSVGIQLVEQTLKSAGNDLGGLSRQGRGEQRVHFLLTNSTAKNKQRVHFLFTEARV